MSHALSVTELTEPADCDPAYDPRSRRAPGRHLYALPDRSRRPGPVGTRDVHDVREVQGVRGASPAVEASVAVLLPPDDERAPLRLTRRGVTVLAVLVGAIGAALVWAAAASAPAASGPAPAAPAVVTVHSGDTLWSLAGRTAPDADPRAEVERLRQLNGLGADVTLRPGQHLRTR